MRGGAAVICDDFDDPTAADYCSNGHYRCPSCPVDPSHPCCECDCEREDDEEESESAPTTREMERTR